jgi:hypothetical protein
VYFTVLGLFLSLVMAWKWNERVGEVNVTVTVTVTVLTLFNALINTLYEASHPKHPKCVPGPLYSRAHIHTCIWFQQNAAHLSKD